MAAPNSRSAGTHALNAAITYVGCVIAGVMAGAVLTAMKLPLSIALVGVAFNVFSGQIEIWRLRAVLKGQSHRAALAALLTSVLRLGTIYALYGFELLSPVTALLAIYLSTILGPLVALRRHVLLPSAVLPSLARSREQRCLAAQLAKTGARVWLFHFSTTITLRSDVILLAALSTPTEVGLYASAAGLSQSILSVSGALKTRLQVAVLQTRPKYDYKRELVLMLGVAAPMAIFIAMAAPSVVALLFGSAFNAAANPLRLLALAAVGQFLMDGSQGMLVAQGRIRVMNRVATLGAATCLVTLGVLVPWFGATGAAMSTLVTYSIAGSVGIYAALRTPRIPSEMGSTSGVGT
jgi:O-antigen/teichoic acid export membrane protein